MRCQPVIGRIKGLFTRSSRARCICTGSFYYDRGRRACVIPDTITEEVAAERRYSDNMVRSRRERDAEKFLLDQVTDFGVPDPEFGGSQGAWRCSMPGDDSWQLSFGERILRDVWR